MTAGRHLIHRCDVQRYADAAQGYGDKRTPANHLTAVHFRLIEKTQRAFNSIAGQWVVSTRYQGMFLFSADVAAGDRITNVVDEYGEAVDGNFEVAGGMKRRGHAMRHKMLELHKVS